MKVLYDNVSPEYIYPLSKNDVTEIKQIISASIIEKITYIRFSCNTKTTREGRVVKDTNKYNIRINFCLNKFRSLVLSEDKKYIMFIHKFGGLVNLDTRFITWNMQSAKKYAKFILLHEIAHIVFAEEMMDGQLKGRRGSVSEEEWCNHFALELLAEE